MQTLRANGQLDPPIHVTSPANQDLLQYNSGTGKFENVTNPAIITHDPTGFDHPENVIVSYDSATRKVTLTGTFVAYWEGEPITALVSGWVSDAHTATNGPWFLYYDGSVFSWSTSSWTFDKLQIAYVYYGASNKFGVRETHGLMDWRAHEEFHRVVGTYRQSGGDLSGYTIGSTTAAERRPNVAETIIHDEDVETTNVALTTELYTQVYLSGTNTVNFAVDAAEIVPVSAANPYYNQYTGGAWVQTLVSTSQYTSIWLMAIPAAADATSQKYRFIWVQGQSEGTLAQQQALTPNDLSLGNFTTVSTEFVFLAHVIIQYVGGNWKLTSVTQLTGSRFSQSGSAAGYLSIVATDATLTGDGTSGNPLTRTNATITSGTGTSTSSLTVTSTYTQIVISGSHRFNLPSTATLSVGRSFQIINSISAASSVNVYGDDGIKYATLGPLTESTFTCLNITNTSPSWSVSNQVRYIDSNFGGLKITNGELALGTPGTVTASSTNAVTASSHTHALTLAHNDTSTLQGGTAGEYYHLTSAQYTNMREVLTAARTYYVATTGSDSNTGLTVGSPFLTIQKAVDVAAALDTSTYNITIQIANGTYSFTSVNCRNILGSGTVTIVGDETTFSNVVIDGAFIKSAPGTSYYIKGMQFKKTSTSSTSAIASTATGAFISVSNVDFNTGWTNHLFASSGTIVFTTALTVSGGATRCFYATLGGRIYNSGSLTVTITGTPAFTVFAIASELSDMLIASTQVTFSGSATGTRYTVTLNSVINTAGGGATYLPGNASGSAATGGQYA